MEIVRKITNNKNNTFFGISEFSVIVKICYKIGKVVTFLLSRFAPHISLQCFQFELAQTTAKSR